MPAHSDAPQKQQGTVGHHTIHGVLRIDCWKDCYEIFAHMLASQWVGKPAVLNSDSRKALHKDGVNDKGQNH